MLWRRQKRILVPPTTSNGVWRTHCQTPILFPVSGRHWRLYFSGRDERNRSHGFLADIAIGESVDVLDIQEAPVLAPGGRGRFDAEGAMPGALIADGAELRLYYMGWAVRRDVPFQTAIGLAISRDGGLTFQSEGRGPVLGQSFFEPFSALVPSVYTAAGGYRMFYPGVVSWQDWDGRPEPRYALKTAVSADGLSWQVRPEPALDFTGEDEGGLTRPGILRHGGLHHMWYSRRGWRGYRTTAGESYRLGYAVSRDGETWHRRDQSVGFLNPPQPGDWDSMMQAYPAILRIGDRVLCFYSGNGFGQSGIGYATLEGGVASLVADAA